MKNIDWEILKVLYEKRSITKAAEALYMTQSALTKRIKAIEAEWNVEIVERSSKGVSFTEEGRYLVNKANVMLDFLREIEKHFSESRMRKKAFLKIGVPNSFARFHMPGLLKEYTEHINELQIKTVSNSSDVLIRQLMDGTIDIGIICGDYPYMGEKVCLFEDGLFVAAPKGTKIDDVEKMPLIESVLNPMVKLMIDQWWKSCFGSMPHEVQFVPFSEIAIEMVEHGLGITFLFGTDWKVDKEKISLIPVYNRQKEQVSRKVWMMLSDQCYEFQEIMDFVTFVEKYYHVN